MQHWIFAYIATLQKHIDTHDCSIHDALTAVLPTLDTVTIHKVIESADDLIRIMQLELLRRQDTDDELLSQVVTD